MLLQLLGGLFSKTPQFILCPGNFVVHTPSPDGRIGLLVSRLSLSLTFTPHQIHTNVTDESL